MIIKGIKTSHSQFFFPEEKTNIELVKKQNKNKSIEQRKRIFKLALLQKGKQKKRTVERRGG